MRVNVFNFKCYNGFLKSSDKQTESLHLNSVLSKMSRFFKNYRNLSEATACNLLSFPLAYL